MALDLSVKHHGCILGHGTLHTDAGLLHMSLAEYVLLVPSFIFLIALSNPYRTSGGFI